MKISIIIPVYNVETYIEECLQSVMSQTYTGAMECILVDDCGQDCSMEIARQLIDRYDGPIEFRIERHQHNRGLSAARNTGMDLVTGDYIYFIDSDDSILPETIQLFVDVLSKYPEAEMIQGGAICDNIWLDIETKNLPEYSEDFTWIKRTMLRRAIIPVTSWNKMLNRRLIESNNIRFKEGLIHEDEVFNFVLAKYLNKIAFVKKNLYIYRTNRDNSIMNLVRKTDERNLLIEIAAECTCYLDSNCFNDQYNLLYPILYDGFFTVNDKQLRKRIKGAIRNISKYVDAKRRILLTYMSSPLGSVQIVKKLTGYKPAES